MARRTITHRKALQYAKALAAHERASVRGNPGAWRRASHPAGFSVEFRPIGRKAALAKIQASGGTGLPKMGWAAKAGYDDRYDYVIVNRSGKFELERFERVAHPGYPPDINPSSKAQRFIGRKIRRLAREGMPAPRRVAAAYSLARRAGFKVPRRARKNPAGVSESHAWREVQTEAKKIVRWAANNANLLPGGIRLEYTATYIANLAGQMLRQVQAGVHENPTLAVLGNPPAKVVGTLSHRLYELRYKHAEDGKDYRHPFGPGAAVKLLADGSVWITAKHALWKDH